MILDRFMQLRQDTGRNHLALHGTSLTNANLIRAQGLRFERSNYIMTLPPLLDFPEAEARERLLGSVMSVVFHSSKAVERARPELKNEFPAILVFRVPAGHPNAPLLAYLNDNSETPARVLRLAGWDEYRSFGKHNISFPPQMLAAVVVLGQEEIENTKRQAVEYLERHFGPGRQGDSFAINRFIRSHLAVKCLQAVCYAAQSSIGDPVMEF